VLEFLVVLTVAEIVLVLVVLASYLGLIRQSLRRTAKTLAKVGFGVRAIETQAEAIGPAVLRINAALEDVAAAAPGLVERVDRLARP
jgi:uncharacterized protein YoxC